MAQYQSVNALADQTAQNQFQTYGGQFVAPVNSQQQTGIAGTNAAANEAQPYYGAATNTLGQAQAGTSGVNNAALGLTAASSGAVNATPITGQQINQYMSPYLQDVAGSEAALLNQNNQQQQSGALGTAISSGAFGGDRTGIAAANLEQQQNLSNANIYSGLLNTGYNNALATAQQQQGVTLSAAQANRAALGTAGQQLASIGQTQYGEGANTASELGALGTGAQTAGLSGAAAQLQAGTVEQQTQQAQDTALYNQFEQQQSYPFQVDQFLANIAEGTGALSGSTTTTTQPGGFFSDERLKEDKRPIGKTFDGQTIYSYRMKGDPRTRIGLMAQEVEDKHPSAVGLAGAYKTVDYGKATKEAANKSHFHSGGVVPMVRAAGGLVPLRAALGSGGDAGDLSQVLAMQQAMYGAGGMGGVTAAGAPHGGKAMVPQAQGSTPQLVTAHGGLQAQPSGAQNAQALGNLAKTYTGLYDDWKLAPSSGMTDATLFGGGATAGQLSDTDLNSLSSGLGLKAGGRAGFLNGGMPYSQNAGLDIPDDTNQRQLQTAPGLQKSPSGLQSAVSLGSGLANIAETAMDFFSRGGLARRGYGAGGDPTSDPDMLPEVDVTAQRPDPITANTEVAPAAVAADPGPAPDLPAATSDSALAGVAPKPKQAPDAGSSEDHRYKHASNVIPLLQGIAAMGTAPTKHLGVALAAGLGAGAGSYVPTQEGLAKAGLTQQEAAGRGLENQLTQQKLNYLTQTPPTVSSPAAAPVSSTPAAPLSFAQQLRTKYAQALQPVTPQEAANLQYAHKQAVALGSDQPVKAAQDAIENRKTAATFAVQQEARDNYDAAVNTYQATKDSNPALAASAAATADAYQQYTGDEPKMLGGVQVNGRTMQPYIGREAQRLSPETYTQMAMQLDQKVDVPAGDPSDPGKTIQVPLYRKMGYQTKRDAMAAMPPEGTPDVPGRAPTPPNAVTAQPTATPAAHAVSPSSRTGATAARPAPAAAPPALRPGQTPSVPTSVLPAPVAVKAFSDPKYFPPKQPNQIGTTFGSTTGISAEAEAKRKAELQAVASDNAASAGAALQYAQAAKAILDSKGAPVTGPLGSLVKMVTAPFGGVDASNYETLAKQLGNLAIQAGKGNFPNATQKEVGLQVEQLSPSATQTGPALRHLLDETIRINQYTKDSATLANDYVDRGGVALRFGDWNEAYHARAAAVNAPTVGAPKQVTSQSEYDALKKGDTYVWNGKTRVKQ